MKYRKLADLQRDVETLEGDWELSPDHELTYRERGRSTPNPNGLGRLSQEPDVPVEAAATFKGSLVAAEPDALVISVTMKENEARTVTGLVKLSGKWELDEKNRITFSLKRGLDRDDKLTFQGAWEINDRFQVTYTFKTREVLEGSGKKRRRVTRTTQQLVFEGRWDLSEKNCLTYLVGIDPESSFRFRGTFETSSILAKAGEIRYRAGIEFKTKRGKTKSITRTIALFGKWKLSDDLALSFEVEYADGRSAAIDLGVTLDLEKFRDRCPLLPDEISVDLTSRAGDPLGVEIVLTKDLFEDNVQTFVRFRESMKETALEAGIRIPW